MEFEYLKQANIRIKSNKSSLKIYQSNCLQTVKLNFFPNYSKEKKNSKKDSKKYSKTETSTTSKKVFTPIYY